MLDWLLATLAAFCVFGGGYISHKKKADKIKAGADVFYWFVDCAPKECTLVVLGYLGYDVPPSLVVVPLKGPVTRYDHLQAPTQLASLNPNAGSTMLIARGWLYCIGAKCQRLGLFSHELQILPPAPTHVFCPALILQGEKLLVLTWEMTRWPRPRGVACRKLFPEDDSRYESRVGCKNVRSPTSGRHGVEDEWHVWLDELDLQSGEWHQLDRVTIPLARAAVLEATWIETEDLRLGGLLWFGKDTSCYDGCFGSDQYFLSIDKRVIGLQRLARAPACKKLGRWPQVDNQVFSFPATASERVDLAWKLHNNGSTQLCSFDTNAMRNICTALVVPN